MIIITMIMNVLTFIFSNVLLYFVVEECDDIEKKTKRMFLFFLLNVVSTCFSFALFLVAIMACCSTSEQVLQVQFTFFDSF